MDLKPFMSSSNVWRKHFEESRTKNGNRKFRSIQEGSGFPSTNVVSVSPTKQAEEIAKSEIVEINRVAKPRKAQYKRRSNKVASHNKSVPRKAKRSNSKKKNKKILSHRKKRK